MVYLAIALLVMSVIVVPGKGALHSFSLSWIVPYIYLTYFHATSYTNEWTSSIVSSIARPSLKGGFSLGDCCDSDSFKETTSELLNNIGFLVVAVIGGWLVFGIAKIVDKYLTKEKD